MHTQQSSILTRAFAKDVINVCDENMHLHKCTVDPSD